MLRHVIPGPSTKTVNLARIVGKRQFPRHGAPESRDATPFCWRGEQRVSHPLRLRDEPDDLDTLIHVLIWLVQSPESPQVHQRLSLQLLAVALGYGGVPVGEYRLVPTIGERAQVPKPAETPDAGCGKHRVLEYEQHDGRFHKLHPPRQGKGPLAVEHGLRRLLEPCS